MGETHSLSTGIDNGGPAFPTDERTEQHDNYLPTSCPAQDGMSLRDWFAGQALTMRALTLTGDGPALAQEEIAQRAYCVADAMLAQREKDTGEV